MSTLPPQTLVPADAWQALARARTGDQLAQAWLTVLCQALLQVLPQWLDPAALETMHQHGWTRAAARLLHREVDAAAEPVDPRSSTFFMTGKV